MNKKNLLLVVLGILIGLVFNFYTKDNSNSVPVAGSQETSLTKAVKESEEVCPITHELRYQNANVSFLPVPIDHINVKENDAVGKEFEAAKFSESLYNPETGQDNSNSPYPWFIEDIDTYTDLGEIKVYYGNTAMNHTPHVAYVVKDNKVIFVAGGANIHVERSYPNGLETTETLDWNTDRYKRIKFDYVKGKFSPLWYQISCGVV